MLLQKRLLPTNFCLEPEEGNPLRLQGYLRGPTTACVPARTGEVCLDILQSAWSPAWSLASCLRAIQLLLSEPEPSSPLNCDAGNLLRCGDKRGFWSMARMYTLLLATSNE
jgi:peroxin-4